MRNIVGKKKIFFGLSSLLIIATVVLAFVMGVNIDIEFKGGALINYAYTGSLDNSSVIQTVKEAIGEDVTIQNKTDVTTGMTTIEISLVATKSLTTDAQEEMTQALVEAYPGNEITLVSSNNVNPSIGREFFLKCIVAVVFAAIVIIIFVAIAFRKIGGASAGVTAIIALVHDLIIVFASFVVLGFPLNGNFIAVLLTIIGYSVNDTIVIYDRIRENKAGMPSTTPISEIVNTSLNQTLSRTLNTSITTVLALTVVGVVASLSGITSILTFVIPMAIGMISGAYSSICIAPMLWVAWVERRGDRPGKQSTDKKVSSVGKIRI